MNKPLVCMIAGVAALVAAGCCRTSGPTHKCDFTPIEMPTDGGTDGPMLCGTAVCEVTEVCCYTKAPANATCIPPSRFQELGCEKLDLPCTRPSDCPGGSAVACCVNITLDGSGTVTCRAKATCVLGGGYLACENSTECPSDRPACTEITKQPNGDPFNICE